MSLSIQSVQCPAFASSLYYEAILSDANSGVQIIASRVSSSTCMNSCFIIFTLPESISSSAYQVTLSAINSVGSSPSNPSSPLGEAL